jgi:dethiobiotin synthetase
MAHCNDPHIEGRTVGNPHGVKLVRKGLFITGTDTNVGKTFVGAALADTARLRGIDLGVFKPVSAGGRSDVQCLKEASGITDDDNLINPVALANPLSPDIAAEFENVRIDLNSIYDAFDRLSCDHDRLLVEGAGGILVPLTCNVSMIDLAARFALPVLIVAHATLGTINHTRLTIEALQKRSLPIVGVVYNQTTPGAPSLSAKMSPISVERHTGVKTLGSLPYAPHLAHPGDGARAEFAENHLDLTSLLGS